jgi:hypothetical protein
VSPIDWLRGKTKQKPKPATGVTVAATWQPSGESGCTLTVDNSESRFTPADEAQPIGFVEFTGVMTEDEVEQIRHAFVTGARAKPDWGDPLRCTCVAIYSSCNCATTDIRTRTSTADFHAEQRR